MIGSSALRAISLGCFVVVLCSAMSHDASAGLIPLGSSVTFDFRVGGVSMGGSGPSPIGTYPAGTGFTDFDPGAGFGVLGVSQLVHTNSARIIIPNTGPAALASQGAPAPLAGEVEIEAVVSAGYAVDGLGTPAVAIPIAYPISYGSVPGAEVSFDVEITYSSTFLGLLGTSELHVAATIPPGVFFTTFSGPTITIPALAPGDTLFLSGFFNLMADGAPGVSAEITVFGVPEPSTWMLGVCALVCLLTYGVRRR